MIAASRPDFAEALRAAIEDNDFAAFGGCLLQRAHLEAGLASLAGRPAILAWLQSLAAAFARPRVQALRQEVVCGLAFADIRVEGVLASVPALGPRPVPLAAASLRLCLWARLEAGRAVEVSAITGWGQLLEDAGISVAEAAVSIGASAPCHRPLGELASGLGQLGTEPPLDTPGERWVADFNRRRLSGSEAGRARLQSLLAQMPDARLTLEEQLPTGAGNLLLLRLQGHVAGRRVSLPACKLLEAEAEDEALLVDSLAIAATAHRPFYPE